MEVGRLKQEYQQWKLLYLASTKLTEAVRKNSVFFSDTD